MSRKLETVFAVSLPLGSKFLRVTSAAERWSGSPSAAVGGTIGDTGSGCVVAAAVGESNWVGLQPFSGCEPLGQGRQFSIA